MGTRTQQQRAHAHDYDSFRVRSVFHLPSFSHQPYVRADGAGDSSELKSGGNKGAYLEMKKNTNNVVLEAIKCHVNTERSNLAKA